MDFNVITIIAIICILSLLAFLIAYLTREKKENSLKIWLREYILILLGSMVGVFLSLSLNTAIQTKYEKDNFSEKIRLVQIEISNNEINLKNIKEALKRDGFPMAPTNIVIAESVLFDKNTTKYLGPKSMAMLYDYVAAIKDLNAVFEFYRKKYLNDQFEKNDFKEMSLEVDDVLKIVDNFNETVEVLKIEGINKVDGPAIDKLYEHEREINSSRNEKFKKNSNK